MSHFLTMCEFIGKDEDKIREYFAKRPYTRPGRKAIQIREVKLLDFAVPASLEGEFLKDIRSQAVYEDGEFGNRKKLYQFVKKLASWVGLSKVDFENVQGEQERFAGTKTKFMIIGKLEDARNEKGRELF